MEIRMSEETMENIKKIYDEAKAQKKKQSEISREHFEKFHFRTINEIIKHLKQGGVISNDGKELTKFWIVDAEDGMINYYTVRPNRKPHLAGVLTEQQFRDENEINELVKEEFITKFHRRSRFGIFMEYMYRSLI